MEELANFLISTAYAENGAPATGQRGLGMGDILFFVGLLAIFYFLLIRPQQKRAKEHRNMVESISKGDEIVTTGGMFAKVIEISEQSLTIELAEGVQVKLQRSAISSVLPKGSLKAAEKEQ